MKWFFEYIREQYGEKSERVLWKKCKQLCVKTLLAVQPALVNEYYGVLPKDLNKKRTDVAGATTALSQKRAEEAAAKSKMIEIKF
jgi:hypothetical protein